MVTMYSKKGMHHGNIWIHHEVIHAMAGSPPRRDYQEQLADASGGHEVEVALLPYCMTGRAIEKGIRDI